MPQALSYATLVGVPVQNGLYAAAIAPFFYMFLGTSRQVAIGPVAIISLLVNTALTIPVVVEGPDKVLYASQVAARDENVVKQARQLAFIVGIVYLILGQLRLGWLTTLIPGTVFSAFTSACGLDIISTQLGAMFGIKTTHSSMFQFQLVLQQVWIPQRFSKNAAAPYQRFLLGLRKRRYELLHEYGR